jgi:hypothetical protein
MALLLLFRPNEGQLVARLNTRRLQMQLGHVFSLQVLSRLQALLTIRSRGWL